MAIPDQSKVETATIANQEESVAIQCSVMGNDCKAILLSMARGIDRANTKLTVIDKSLAQNQIVTESTAQRVEALEKQRTAMFLSLLGTCATVIGGVILFLITGKA
jgi:hypothetical protein